MNLAGKVVVISGGASGLGEAAGRHLATEKGAKVGIIDLNAERGAAMVADLGADKAMFCKADVRSLEQVDAAIESIMVKFGAIHGDINAAGIPGAIKILDKEGKASTRGKFSDLIDINLKGVFNVMAKCAEQMAKNQPDAGGERGVIINISSGAAEAGQIGQAAYSGSKAGINGMNMPAARELGAHGIRVTSIAPGLFETPLLKAQDPAFIEKLVTHVEAPKRLGAPDEFARACAFILENGYFNGRTLQLDAASILRAK
jgi:3-hydroxyacyl-CoA dehydrogenase / 3-hydroxy-2-methylbutyryl-CoA dehydrogenase